MPLLPTDVFESLADCLPLSALAVAMRASKELLEKCRVRTEERLSSLSGQWHGTVRHLDADEDREASVHLDVVFSKRSIVGFGSVTCSMSETDGTQCAVEGHVEGLLRGRAGDELLWVRLRLEPYWLCSLVLRFGGPGSRPDFCGRSLRLKSYPRSPVGSWGADPAVVRARTLLKALLNRIGDLRAAPDRFYEEEFEVLESVGGHLEEWLESKGGIAAGDRELTAKRLECQARVKPVLDRAEELDGRADSAGARPADGVDREALVRELDDWDFRDQDGKVFLSAAEKWEVSLSLSPAI